jgi:Fe-S cluster assembly ATP-binding protein
MTVRDLLDVAAGKEKHCSAGPVPARISPRWACARNDYLDREVDASLSGGEVKRIEIATVLARKAELMIFDEPEAGIDLWSFARLTETFAQIHDETCAPPSSSSPTRSASSAWPTRSCSSAAGSSQHRGPVDEIYPKILADTLGGCPVLEGIRA